MKKLCLTLMFIFSIQHTWAQSFIGTFETGDEVPLWVVAADAATGAPVNPTQLAFKVFHSGSIIASGTLETAGEGLSTGSFDSSGASPGMYQALISGLIDDVTAQICHSFSLVEQGHGLDAVGAEVSGLDGVRPLAQAEYASYHGDLLSVFGAKVADATAGISAVHDIVSGVSDELRAWTRGYSRSRLWYAQSAISAASRNVPADMPSHIEIQLAWPGDGDFSSPFETYFKLYDYPNAATAVKPSQETRSAIPPQDGMFYLSPANGW